MPTVGPSGDYTTVQEAIDSLATVQGQHVIQVADGAYTDPVVVDGPWHMNTSVWIQGNLTNPANVLFETTDVSCVTCLNGGRIGIRGVKFRSYGDGSALFAHSMGSIDFENVDFGDIGIGSNWIHCHVRGPSAMRATGDYTISGGAWRHLSAIYNGMLEVRKKNIQIINTPHFQDCFAAADHNGCVEVHSNTWTGNATGRRYRARRGGVMNATTSTTLPGDEAGIVDPTTFGLYY